jgi:hypothetical protein
MSRPFRRILRNLFRRLSHGTNLRENLDGLVCPLREIEAIPVAKQFFEEPVEFLPAYHGEFLNP